MGRDVAPAPRIPVLEPRPAQIRILIVHGQLSVAAIFLNLVGHHDARYAASGNDDSQRPICCGRIFFCQSVSSTQLFLRSGASGYGMSTWVSEEDIRRIVHRLSRSSGVDITIRFGMRWGVV